MRTDLWTEKEIYLLSQLKPALSGRQIKSVLRLLGYDRSTRSIQRKAERLEICYQDSKVLEGDFSEEETKAINQVVKDEIFILSDISNLPSLEITKTKSPMNLLAHLEEIRKKVKGNYNAIKDTIIPGEQIVLDISDVHYGATVLDPMSGNELYNTKIALQYILDIPIKLGEAIPDREYAGIVLVLGGDIVDGEEIYATQAKHQDLPVIQQKQDLVEAFWQVIQDLTIRFPTVRVVCVPGNHGRSGKHHDERSNWDNVVYQELEMLVRLLGNKNISVEYSHGAYYNFDVNGWKGHVRHFGVRYDGTAGMEQKMGGWYAKHLYDFMLCHHFHNVGLLNYNGKLVFRNGSLMPANELADRMAKSDPPKQIVFGISKKRLPTFINFLTWTISKV